MLVQEGNAGLPLEPLSLLCSVPFVTSESLPLCRPAASSSQRSSRECRSRLRPDHGIIVYTLPNPQLFEDASRESEEVSMPT